MQLDNKTTFPNRAESIGDAADWRRVEEVLMETKMGDRRRALARAQENGCQPEDILWLISKWGEFPEGYFKNPVGALHRRLSVHTPKMSVADGWPPPEPDFVADEKRATAARQNEERSREFAQRKLQREQERRDNERRELLYGKELDAMSDAERAELLAATCWRDKSADLIRTCAKMVRVDLLAVIAHRRRMAEGQCLAPTAGGAR
jgi:hypothetical protein